MKVGPQPFGPPDWWSEGNPALRNTPIEEAREPNLKPTNPKDALGSRKVPFSLIPIRVIAELAVAMTEGALKYGPHNYREAGVRGSIYYDACFRHLAQWWEGQDTDTDSGIHHVTKAIACLVILRQGILDGTWTDDRPPSGAPSDWLSALNADVACLCDRLGGAK